jgi:hypothetical protein
MSKSLCSQFRSVRLISLLIILGIFLARVAAATCYSTPRIAVDAVVTSSLFPSALKNGGYRITNIQSDPVLGQTWAMIASCGHPEWPAFALPANRSVLKAHQETKRSLTEGVRTGPVVRAGEIVRLWRQESLLRIEVTGVSEESGGLGKTIRVRLLRRNTDDRSIEQQFSGVVRGPSSVEIQP